MRKISKSRADDDIVSSTNGSFVNDDQADADRQTDPDEKEPNVSNEDAQEDEEELSDSKVKPAPKKGKSKAKKKKAAKEKKVEEEYEVEKVVDSKRIKGKMHYLIRWKGYTATHDSWEPENTLSCPELISKFNDEKENSKNKESKPAKKDAKRKAKKGTKASPSKRAKKEEGDESDDESADENAEYEVERILEVRTKKTGKREFLIHWKGWASKFDTWEPESNLNCSEMIKKFMEKVSKAHSVDARNLRVAPVTTNRYTLQAPSSGRRLSKRRGQSQRVRYDDAE